MSRAVMLIAAGVLAAGLAAGCGEDEGGSETTPAITGEPIDQTPDEAEGEVRELLDAFYSSDRRARCEAFGTQAYAAVASDLEACLESEGGGAPDVRYTATEIEVSPEDGTAEATVGAGGESGEFQFSVEDGEWKIQLPPPLFL